MNRGESLEDLSHQLKVDFSAFLPLVMRESGKHNLKCDFNIFFRDFLTETPFLSFECRLIPIYWTDSIA